MKVPYLVVSLLACGLAFGSVQAGLSKTTTGLTSLVPEDDPGVSKVGQKGLTTEDDPGKVVGSDKKDTAKMVGETKLDRTRTANDQVQMGQ